MASKSAPWADQPYALFETPKKTMDVKSHIAVYMANEMAAAHNCFVRSLNSIVQQGPYVKEPKDAADFFFYCSAFVAAVTHHHETEETVLFPDIEKATNQPGFMDGNREQHQAFHDGLEAFRSYCDTKNPAEYSWPEMNEKFEAFAPVLYEHMKEEIGVFLALQKFDETPLKGAWDKAEEIAKGGEKPPGLFDVLIPQIFGTADKTHEGGINSHFPPLPFFFPYLIQYYFGRKHKGAWRFCPCDFHGKPRPLQFTAERTS